LFSSSSFFTRLAIEFQHLVLPVIFLVAPVYAPTGNEALPETWIIQEYTLLFSNTMT